MDNRPLIYLEQERIVRDNFIVVEELDEQVAHSKERLREKVWRGVLKASKYSFYPLNVVAATKDEERSVLIGIRVDVMYRRHISVYEMKKFFDSLYSL